uniref:F-box domain-containing protein n=1 Tax=Caenorhabditis tropicalis TaxID=1561998 RepID=A0A1I7TMU6_9PELO
MEQPIQSQPSAIKVFLYYAKQREKNGKKTDGELWDLIKNGDETSGGSLKKIKAKHGKKTTKKVIKQLVLDNPSNLRLCILSEVIEKKSMIEAFLNITNIIGTQNIDSHDFEFWFERFNSGNWDPNQKSLSDMPIEVLGAIAEKSDFMSQMQLRGVTRGFRDIVDQVKPSISVIKCYFEKEVYASNVIGNICIWNPKKITDKIDTMIYKFYDGSKNLNRALDDLEHIFENRRLQLTIFEWCDSISIEVDKQLIEILMSLKHKLEFSLIDIDLKGNLMIKLLKVMNPKELKSIHFGTKFESRYLDQIAQLEQWKQAHEVYFRGEIRDLSRHLHHFMHLRDVELSAVSISMEDVLFVKNLFFQKDQMQEFTIRCDNALSQEEYDETVGPSEIELNEDHIDFDVYETGEYRIYHIPGSNDFLGLFGYAHKVRGFRTEWIW